MTLAEQARPHDLLWLKRIPRWHDAPEWVDIALARLPVVVVRRAGAPKGLVSVGVRGERFNQRYGALISIAEIERCVSPEMLQGGVPLRLSRDASSSDKLEPAARFTPAPRDPGRANLPAFTVLHGLEPFLRRFRLVWGPTGSVGFELATGMPVVQPSSDLDLLIRLPEWIGRDTGQTLLGILSTQAAQAGVRVDAQLETPGGAVSLAEYAGSTGRVLLRSTGEPLLVDDPWAWGANPHYGAGAGQSSHHGESAGRNARMHSMPDAA